MTKVPMGPPSPKNPNPEPLQQQEHHEHHHPQPPPDQIQSLNPDSEIPSSNRNPDCSSNPIEKAASSFSAVAAVPYTIPAWSQAPSHPFSLEVLKDGSIIDQFDVSGKGAYMFGRVDLCDFVLEHPTVSRFHAVLQFKGNGDAFLYDVGSTHGTFINKAQVKKKVYTELHVGDVIRFGQSSRLYIFQGPSELMLPEGDLKQLRNAKIREEMEDREASLSRARLEASLANGVSWGMQEDAIEETGEGDADEVTWQTYKGQLTEKQEKTRDKIIKRLEKVANMKREIDAIRAKDIAQGGLTQGQQTQIARNEQRISQIMEELENLEETLNESIQESIGARGGKAFHKKKGDSEETDEFLSDEDEFYDRTKTKIAAKKGTEPCAVETAYTLLDKKNSIIKEMEEKTSLLMKEKTKVTPKTDIGNEHGDALDAYMTGLSSKLVLDATERLEKELSSLRIELDRIEYLLKIADPMGEASYRRASKSQGLKFKQPDISTSHSAEVPKELNNSIAPTNPVPNDEVPRSEEKSSRQEVDCETTNFTECKVPEYAVKKPLWLGATQDMIVEEKREVPLTMDEPDDFVSYKDRKKALAPLASTLETESVIEDAAPGLIIRKRKLPEKPAGTEDETSEVSTSTSTAENTAVDDVALLLKHKRGYFASEGDDMDEKFDKSQSQTTKENVQSKRVLGPERPDFLRSNRECESWVPPQGQSGDGRTALNDRYGY